VFLFSLLIFAQKFKILILLNSSLRLIPMPYMNHDQQQDRNSGLLQVQEQVE